eukprot:12195174-Ditylum_brightwellii.AAC.2
MESTLLESDDESSNASPCLSEGVQAITCDARSSDPCGEKMSRENGTSSGTQPENITNDSMHPPLDVPTHTPQTHRKQCIQI